MKIQEVIEALEQFAPLPLQESYDNAGLQVGLTENNVSGALLCLDVTEDVIDEAVRKGCNLVVSHHPLLFRGLKCLSNRDYIQRTVWKAVRNDICVVSMHTNLDNAEGGVNHMIAQKLNLNNVEFLAEERTVINSKGNEVKGGSGIIGTLPEPMQAADFVELVNRTFNVGCCQTNPLLLRSINRVAVCGGAGSFLAKNAMQKGADAFLVGEMGYHEFFGMDQLMQVLCIGHYESEQFTTKIFRQIINALNADIPVYEYGSTSPVTYFYV